MTILAVDDNRTNRKLLRARLESEGHTILEAGNGVEALALLETRGEGEIGLIISDILMPRMDGYEFCHRIRSGARHAAVPFVFLTATYTSPADETFALELGADLVLKKPLEMESLRRALELASGGPRTARTTRPWDQETIREYSDRLVAKLEQKNAEMEQLTAELRKLSKAVEETADSIVITDREGLIQYVNPAFERTTGYTAAEVIGRTPRILKSGKHQVRHYERLWRTILAGETFRGEFINRKKSGELFHEEQTITPIHDESGEVTHFVAAGRDVTRRVRAEREIRESEERFRQIADTIREVFWLAEPAPRRMLYVSPAFTIIWGRSSDELLRDPAIWLEAIHPDDRDRALRRTGGEGVEGERDVEYRIVRPDGEVRWIRERESPVLDEDGRVVRIAGVAQDVTRQRELEQQLIQAQKLESLGTLASGIAHDFNNILSIILGHGALLERRTGDPDAQRHSLEAITAAAQRGAALVRQLLTFARKSEAAVDLIQLNDVVADIRKLVEQTFPRAIEFRVHLDPALPRIEADATQVHQVILNLCVNARDAMPSGGILSIETSTVDGWKMRERFPDARARRYAQLTVTDTGTGIDESTKRRMFEPFFTTKGVGQGTGLGLSLVHSIVTNQGGCIDVDSAPGRGTAFVISLPVPEQKITLDVDTAREAAEAPGGTETVLVIEDEELLRQLATIILSSKGYRVLTAHDGLAGIETFTRYSGEIAAVITDFGLPRVSGAEVFRTVRSLEPDVPVIIASGFIDPVTKDELRAAGAELFVQKPYVPGELLLLLRSALDGRRSPS